VIAALFVATGGCYFGLPDVDPWDEARDARLYTGPWPVVAHPPCGPWGIFARQGKTTRALGDDDGCFQSALRSVRTWGGVLEHPKLSTAWQRFGLHPPNDTGGWMRSLLDGGWTCEVRQGEYGLSCEKPTWLYAYGVDPPSLRWPCRQSFEIGAFDKLSRRQRAATPPEFRDLLLSIARTAQRKAA
jgi:hypothetical protein